MILSNDNGDLVLHLVMPNQPRPTTDDVVIWDVEPEGTTSTYWVRIHSRGSAAQLFEGPNAWGRARVAAEALASPESVVWHRHKDGHFERLSTVRNFHTEEL